VQLGKGSASLQASDEAILDYGYIANALFGGRPTPTPGTVSFKVVWSGVDERLNITNTDPVYGGFAGEFVRNSAQMGVGAPQWGLHICFGSYCDFLQFIRRNRPRTERIVLPVDKRP
jgi:hypothetical protein